MINLTGVTTEVILDKRTLKKDGTYPVKLRITYNRFQKYYALKFSFKPEEFDMIMTGSPRKENKETQLIIQNIEKKAVEIITHLDQFSFNDFENEFLKQKKRKNSNVFDNLKNYIDILKNQNRLGSAETYKSTLYSLQNFSGAKSLNFREIDVSFLSRYENWMLESGKSITTVGIYLRSLRTVYNMAIEEEIVDKKYYPFSKRKYQIPLAKNVKKALTIDDIQKIMEYEAEKWSVEEYSRDLWLFSYFSNGMNIADIARLKYSDISGNKLVFVREKTKQSSRRAQRPIVVMLIPQSQEIIKKWGNKPFKENYIFDIINNEDSIETKRAKIKQKVKLTNKYMKRIATALNIEGSITTYWARHTFSTVLKQSGASIEFISEALGHTSIQTTQNYLDSFADDTKLAFVQNLIPKTKK
jgi:site-specific recombinase XerD